MTLKEQIKKAFPDAEFSNHCSDLYIINTPGLRKWLKENYQFFGNITRFRGNGSNWEGKACLEIPFAYIEYYNQ